MARFGWREGRWFGSRCLTENQKSHGFPAGKDVLQRGSQKYSAFQMKCAARHNTMAGRPACHFANDLRADNGWTGGVVVSTELLKFRGVPMNRLDSC